MKRQLLVCLAFVTACAEASVPPKRTAQRQTEERAETPRERPALPAPDVAHPAKLRELQVTRLPGTEPAFVLSDPYRYTEKTAVLSGPGFLAATLFDGRRTPSQIAAEVELSARVSGTGDDVRAIATDLESGFLLDSPRFRAFKAWTDARYAQAATRPVFHFGRELPTERTALAKVLEAYDHAPGGVGGAGRSKRSKKLVAVIAPHIDPRSGGAVYSHAYAAIRREAADADLYVLLGTGHQPLSGSVGLTDKSYETPFGVVETDRDALRTVADALGDGALRNAWAHRTEHSLEFTSVFLRHTLERVPRVRGLPILVGHFAQRETGPGLPEEDPEVAALVRSLRALRASREARGERVVFVAGVDLAHRGVRFGHPAVLETDLRALERMDRTFSAKVVAGDAPAALDDYGADAGERNYCGFAPLYVLARVLGPAEGEVLAYGHDLTAGAVVTFFAATMRQ